MNDVNDEQTLTQAAKWAFHFCISLINWTRTYML
jgi:hypothetical protein